MNADIRAHYVTYRGKGSGENTEVFEARKYWIFGAWNQSTIRILVTDKNVLLNKIFGDNRLENGCLIKKNA